MPKLLNIPFLILTFSLILGVIFGYYIEVDLTFIIVTQAITVIGLIATWLYAKKIFRKAYGFSILTIITFITFGITLVQIHHPKNNSDHYIHSISDKHLETPITINFYIKERLKSTSYYEKYIITLQSIENKKITGNLLLKIPKDSLKTLLSTGDSYITHTTINPIPKALNPDQFDYAYYLSQQYIFHQITCIPNQLISIDTPIYSILRIAHFIRFNINQKLNAYNFTKKQLSIINALLLGQRQDIDRDIYADYKDAGAIHILAVSGLHVGILLMILNLILKPLHRLKKNGSVIKTILIIIFLWCFAIIAGLSPSVLRAVTMFSFVAIGAHIRSKTSIYNSLIVSIFILLCIRPLLIFSIGFQLSYMAILAIVWIQPSIASIYRPKFYIDKTLWEVFTVTIAAQLGVLPLTLFYFNQFPLLFFIANLIIIPFLGIILSLGIAIILLPEIPILTDWISVIFGNAINLMNTIVHWVSKQKIFLITEISFSWRMLIIVYLLIIVILVSFKKYSIVKIRIVFINIIVMLLILVYEKHQNNMAEELVIFHNRGNTTLGMLQNQYIQIYSKDSISEITKKYILNDYLIKNNSQLMNTKRLKNIYRFKEKTILIIDSYGIYSIKDLRPDVIILTNSPKINLNRIITTLQPKLIIADGSNYKSSIDLWEHSCNKQEIPFHRTDKKGAYIFK